MDINTERETEYELLEHLGLSEYVKNHYMEQHMSFTDFEKANLLWCFSSYWQDKIDFLDEIVNRTDDEKLKLQIKDRLEYEIVGQKKFMENTDRKAIYTLSEHEDGSGEYYFTNIEKALAFGIERCERCEAEHINIKKFELDTDDEYNCRGDCTWDKHGKIYDVVCCEHDNDMIDQLDDTHGLDFRFEEALVPLPYPFERGDIVHYIPTGQIGIVENSQKEWRKSLERMQNKKIEFNYDTIDAVVVSISYVGEDGCLGYDHVNYLYLKKITECENKAEMELMECISRILKGEETPLANLDYYKDEYLKSLKKK